MLNTAQKNLAKEEKEKEKDKEKKDSLEPQLIGVKQSS